RIIWKGGASTDLEIKLPVNSLTALPQHQETERRICELAAGGVYDEEIARILTDEGHRSPWQGDRLLPTTVQRIRLQHRIKVKHRTRWRRVENMLTVSQLAVRLQIPIKWIYVQLKRGAILTDREPSGRFLFPNADSTVEEIRRLRKHQVNQIDLRGV